MKEKNYAHITSNNIKYLMKQKGVSIRKLSINIGISASSLKDSLKSKKGLCIDNLFRVAEYFNLTVNDLCNENLLN